LSYGSALGQKISVSGLACRCRVWFFKFDTCK